MNKKDSLGDRMKDYEQRAFRPLIRRVPVMLRADGKAFHSWVGGLERPFDANLRSCMCYAMYKLCDEIEGARIGYCQSDEISLLICDYKSVKTQAWFDYRSNKIESVASSICTAAFNLAAMKYLPEHFKKKGPAVFDARAWNLPKEEVTNYFLWRQRDCEKNSVSQLAMAHFSTEQLKKKNGSQKQDMLMLEKSINWNDLETVYKRGSTVFKITVDLDTVKRSKWVMDLDIPIISRNREYIENWVQDIPEVSDIGFKKGLHIIERIKL